MASAARASCNTIRACHRYGELPSCVQEAVWARRWMRMQSMRSSTYRLCGACLTAVVLVARIASAAKPRLCLSMIVKDEAANIERCLNSVKPFIDCWSISDTGSSDNTTAIITQTLADIPGTLRHDDWKDFAHNRNLALMGVEGEYALVIDADERLVTPPGYVMPDLKSDAYEILMHAPAQRWHMIHIVRMGAKFTYRGVVHEHLYSDIAETRDVLQDVYIEWAHAGCRAHDPDIYRKDALILEEALKTEPNHTRHMFYLAQSYRDSGNVSAAIDAYRRRAAVPKGRHEQYISWHMVGLLREQLNDPLHEIVADYHAAHEIFPTRPEALFQVAIIAMYTRKAYRTAAIYLDEIRAMSPPEIPLFYDPTILEWRADLERAVCAYWLKDDPLAIQLNTGLLERGVVPPAQRSMVEENLKYSTDRVWARQGTRRMSMGSKRSGSRLNIAIYAKARRNAPFDPDSCARGLAGSEEAVVYASEALVAIGHNVTVYGSLPADSNWSQANSNPRYVQHDESHSIAAKHDIALMWRNVNFELGARIARKVFYWPHDPTPTDFDRRSLSGILFLSMYQRNVYQEKLPYVVDIPQIIAGNGIPERSYTPQNRQPHSCVYASSYLRGLSQLLEAWPSVLEEFPDATLNVYYGRETHMADTAEEIARLVELMDQLPGVTEHGKVGHDELQEAFERASIFSYPCVTSGETFCITAMRAQAAGLIPVVYRRGALFETVSEQAPVMLPRETYAEFLKRVMQAEDSYDRDVFRKFAAKHTWAKVVGHWLTFMRSVKDIEYEDDSDPVHDEL